MEIKKADNNLAVLRSISELAHELGVEKPENVTVVKINGTDDPNRKTLELLQGRWDDTAPWFVVGEEGKVFVLSSMESFIELLNSIREAKYENFNLKLEKAILENLPVDFNDVWVVAMQEIKKKLAESKDKNLLDIDIKKLIKDIKKNHPNLFLRLKDLGMERPM
ncbi:DUF2603 domain-containing protein [Nitrosophilus alvini]|uniref:DUF2603 domain-containing protein n=1 Tax=Nitrosophilus alvini TaxID=2714855 RepID=UPI00190C10AA|nr:DUF2603 domain-containing protein [Nitrosophilus alvini]